MNTHDKIELPAEFVSGNSIPVERATITRERMTEILKDAIEADRKQHDRMLAHEWIRPALGLSEDAPYRFDFYAQQIEGMKADRQRIADQFHKDGFYDGVILGLQAMAACGNAFNADYVELLRSAGVHETVKRAMKEGLYELAGLDSNASEDLRKEIDSTRKEFTQKIIYGSIQNEHT